MFRKSKKNTSNEADLQITKDLDNQLNDDFVAPKINKTVNKLRATKAKLKSKKTKSIIFYSVAFLTVSLLITFVSLFANPSSSVTASNGSNSNTGSGSSNSGSGSSGGSNDYISNNGINLNLVENLNSQKENLDLLVTKTAKKVNNNYVYDYAFSEDNIKENIFTIINDALYANNSFSESPSNYSKRLKYQLLNDQKTAIFNLFLYNKSVTSKKYVSNFKLTLN